MAWRLRPKSALYDMEDTNAVNDKVKLLRG